MSSNDPFANLLERLKTPGTGSPVPVSISRSRGGSETKEDSSKEEAKKGASPETSFDNDSVSDNMSEGQEETVESLVSEKERGSKDSSSKGSTKGSKKSVTSVPELVSIGERPTRCVRKYKIGILPEKPVEFACICCTSIGKGGTFCVQKDCTIKHTGEVFSVQLGDIFVAKSNS